MHQAVDYMDFNSGFQPKGSKFRIKTTTYSCFNSSQGSYVEIPKVLSSALVKAV